MKKINIPGLDDTLYKETMKNGLDVYLLPNKNVQNFYITFNTKFGSIYTEFKKENEKSYTKIPDGVAHFLEHLTFKMEDGDASDYFASIGASSNAYTSYKVTCYETMSFDNFKENLEYLLDFVQTPYYTKENVEAEKGIICEEVNMYKDRPERQLSNEMNKCLFKNDKRKYLVAGTVKDVKSTTLKDIEAAYNTFYHPSNMFIIITGNFNPEEALAIIEENQSKKTFDDKFKIDIKKISEPAKVEKEYLEFKTNVEIEKVNIGIKIPLSTFNKMNLPDIERNIYISMITNSMFGRSSEIRERLVSGNIVTDGIYVYRTYTDDYLIINIIAETPYPQRYISLIKEEIKKIDITEIDLERKKRVAISNFILGGDDIEEVNSNIQSDIVEFGEVIPNLYDIYNKLNIKTAKEIAKKITDKNMSVLVLTKKEN